MSTVYLNGRFVDERRAVVSTLDRGFLYGDGLFETMRAYGARVFRLDEHLARLAKSAKALRIPFTLDAREIESAIAKLLRFNVAQPPSGESSSYVAHPLAPTEERPSGVTSSYVAHPPSGVTSSLRAQARAPVPHQQHEQKDTPEGGCATSAYVRITLTRGIHAGDLGLDTGAPPTLVIHAREFHGYPKTLYRRGMKVALADSVRPSRSLVGRHKTLSYIENLLARDVARKARCSETLFLDERGFVAECSASNIFFVRQGALFTPAASMNILPGITRAVVMELARASGVQVEEGCRPLADVQRADEVFLTNSLMELMPVRELAGAKIGRTVPGALTRRLLDEYRRQVRKECVS